MKLSETQRTIALRSAVCDPEPFTTNPSTPWHILIQRGVDMENFDPLGIHTGDSIVVAPSQTLSDEEVCPCPLPKLGLPLPFQDMRANTM